MECADIIVPPATEIAMRYYQSGNILWIINQAWALIVPLLFLAWGFTGKLEGFSKRIGKNWFFTIAVYVILFVLINQLLDLPLDFYKNFIREHAYGLSTQTWTRWLHNYGISALVAVIGAVAFVWIFYLLLKKSPRRWWLYASIASIVLIFFTSFIQPIWIDPLFNNFGAMKNKELEGKILALASRAGIANGRVYEVDKSKDTKTLNAYVVGFGQTNRVVLWDTTTEQMPEDQILFVMGHEMGHYILDHIWWSLLYMSLMVFVVFYLTYRSANFLLSKYHKRFGFKHLYQIASLPLLIFLLTFFMLLFEPLSNYVSRYMEHEADRFGLEITQNNVSAGEAFLTLQQQNLANPWPGPIYKFWRASHPPLGERVNFSNQYCPWRNDKPLKYSHYFKQE